MVEMGRLSFANSLHSPTTTYLPDISPHTDGGGGVSWSRTCTARQAEARCHRSRRTTANAKLYAMNTNTCMVLVVGFQVRTSRCIGKVAGSKPTESGGTAPQIWI